MDKLSKYSYQLKTKSSLILSPRQQEAFYKEIDYTKQDIAMLKDSNVTIIYPFYRRGEYQKLREENVSYYIPGSSIKGSLLTPEQKKNEGSHVLLIDDIELNRDDIYIDKIEKVQNTDSESQKQVKLEAFFENVAFEMCKEDTSKKSYLFSRENPVTYFETCHGETVKKLNQWCKKIVELLGSEKKIEEDTHLILERVIKNVNTMTNCSNFDSYLMLLGGYKGLLLSLGNVQETSAIQSGLFIDPTTELPYGLVEISRVILDE